MIQWPDKDPDEVALYGIDFADRLDSGATLASVAWDATGVSVTSQGVSGTVASALVSGGTLGSGATITATVTTSDGQTLQETASLQIRSR